MEFSYPRPPSCGSMATMDEHIDMDSPLCRAYWCGNFSCSDAELANAAHIMDSTAVGLGRTLPGHAQFRTP